MFKIKQCQDLISMLFYKHGLMCSSHPVLYILAVIFAFLFVCQPLLKLSFSANAPLQYTTPVKGYKEPGNFSTLPVSEEINSARPRWYFSSPVAYIQQIIVESSMSTNHNLYSVNRTHLQNNNDNNFNDADNLYPDTDEGEDGNDRDEFKETRLFLSSVFDLFEKIDSFRYHDGGQDTSISMSDLCLRVSEVAIGLEKEQANELLPQYNCLFLSPARFWHQDKNKFNEDKDFIKTIFKKRGNFLDIQPSIREILFGISDVDNYNKRPPFKENDKYFLTYAITFVLKEYNQGFIDALSSYLKEIYFHPSDKIRLSLIKNKKQSNSLLKNSQQYLNNYNDNNNTFLKFLFNSSSFKQTKNKNLSSLLKEKNIDLNSLTYGTMDEKNHEPLSRIPVTSKRWNDISTFAESNNFLVHIHYQAHNYFVEYTPLIFAYIVLSLYLYFSVRKIEMVKSKWGLALSAMVTVVASLLMSVSLCIFFGLTPSLNGSEIFPYLVVIIGLENILVITKSVVSTPVHLEVKLRIALGLQKEGWYIFKNLLTELLILTVGFFTFVPAIQEFCLLAVVGLGSDFFLQIFFFTTVLSVDIRRMELSDLQNQAMLLDHSEEFDINNLNNFNSFNNTNNNNINKNNTIPQALSNWTKGKLNFGTFFRNEVKGESQVKNRSFLDSCEEIFTMDGSTELEDERIPKRVRLIQFWARYRILQRILMILVVLWIGFIVYKTSYIEEDLDNVGENKKITSPSNLNDKSEDPPPSDYLPRSTNSRIYLDDIKLDVRTTNLRKYLDLDVSTELNEKMIDNSKEHLSTSKDDSTIDYVKTKMVLNNDNLSSKVFIHIKKFLSDQFWRLFGLSSRSSRSSTVWNGGELNPQISKDRRSRIKMATAYKDESINRRLFWNHWQTLFAYYNISLLARYITIIPSMHIYLDLGDDDTQSGGGNFSANTSIDETGESQFVNSSRRLITWIEKLIRSPRTKMELFMTLLLVFASWIVFISILFILYKILCTKNYSKWRSNWKKRHRSMSNADGYYKQIRESIPLRLIGHKQDIECISYDKNLIASSCLGGQVRIWDSETGECLAVINRNRRIKKSNTNKRLLPRVELSPLNSLMTNAQNSAVFNRKVNMTYFKPIQKIELDNDGLNINNSHRNSNNSLNNSSFNDLENSHKQKNNIMNHGNVSVNRSKHCNINNVYNKNKCKYGNDLFVDNYLINNYSNNNNNNYILNSENIDKYFEEIESLSGGRRHKSVDETLAFMIPDLRDTINTDFNNKNNLTNQQLNDIKDKNMSKDRSLITNDLDGISDEIKLNNNHYNAAVIGNDNNIPNDNAFFFNNNSIPDNHSYSESTEARKNKAEPAMLNISSAANNNINTVSMSCVADNEKPNSPDNKNGGYDFTKFQAYFDEHRRRHEAVSKMKASRKRSSRELCSSKHLENNDANAGECHNVDKSIIDDRKYRQSLEEAHESQNSRVMENHDLSNHLGRLESSDGDGKGCSWERDSFSEEIYTDYGRRNSGVSENGGFFRCRSNNLNKNNYTNNDSSSLMGDDFYSDSAFVTGSAIWSMVFKDQMVILGCGSGHIEFWDALKQKQILNFQQKRSGVTALCLADNRLMAARINGSLDFFLLICKDLPQWNSDLTVYESQASVQCLCISSLQAHQMAINCLQMDKIRIVTAGQDNLIKVYRIEEPVCLFTLIGHTSSVTTLLIDEVTGTIFSGSNDGSVRLWDIRTGTNLHKLSGHQSSILSLAYSEKHVISLGLDDRLCIWVRSGGYLLHCISLAETGCNSITVLSEQYMLSGSHGSLNLWDIEKGTIELKIVLGSQSDCTFVHQLIKVKEDGLIICDYGSQLRAIRFSMVLEKDD